MKFNQLQDVAKQYNIGGGRGDWLNMKDPGDYKVRIASEYEVIAKHWTSAGKPSVCVGKDKGCVFCNVDESKGEKPNKPVVKFLMWVIDRADGKFKIAEVGWTVVKAVGDLQQNDEYEFSVLPEYDVTISHTIKGTGKNASDHNYTIIPARTNKPLTPEEEAHLAQLTPIGDVVSSIKEKALKEYQAMGLGVSGSEPAADEDVPPPFDE